LNTQSRGAKFQNSAEERRFLGEENGCRESEAGVGDGFCSSTIRTRAAMAEKSPRNSSSKKPAGAAPNADPDRMPTKEELLHELRFHGAKPPPRREATGMSRRTRDYLLVAGVGSAMIVITCFRLMSGTDAAVVARLALTGVVLLCGLLWFIFYGVMGRY
jgi:hypothetical protein